MAELPLTGGCLCGAVRFEVTEAPLGASYCHCGRCQRRTGTAASVQVRIVPGSLHVTAGQELLRAYEPDDGFPKFFCSGCGAALWSSLPDTKEPVGIPHGRLRRRPGVRTRFRQFVAYAATWEPIPDEGPPRYPERIPPGTV